jgi:glycosyltransferase involved in cell wall biosynthesis
MISVFLQNQWLNREFDITFSYRNSKEYSSGMNKWIVAHNAKIHPLTLSITFLRKIQRYFPLALPLAYLLSYVEVGDFLRLLQQDKPDILHINNGGYPGAFSCNSMAVAGRLAKIPKITYFLTSTTQDPWWYKPMTFMVRNSVNTFISASKCLQNNSGFLRNKKRSDWINISNTIMDREFESSETIRSKLQIPMDEVVFLCIGDLVKRKGFDKAIDAFSEMTEVGTPRSLLIVGSGPEEENLRNKMKSKTKGVYRIITDDNDSYSIINAADVLLVPSLGEEDWPNVILIAMKYGLPCIISNICGLPEMIVHNSTGYICFEESQWKYNMESLLDANLRSITGNRAQARYERLYREERIIGQYLELWKENNGPSV